MYRLYVPAVCTDCMYRLYVPGAQYVAVGGDVLLAEDARQIGGVEEVVRGGGKVCGQPEAYMYRHVAQGEIHCGWIRRSGGIGGNKRSRR